MKDWNIRYSLLEDLPYLEKWLQKKQDVRWFPFGTSEEIKNVAHNWIGFSRYKLSLTGMIDNQPVAIGTLFLMPYKKVFHQCTFYLLVEEKMRQQGLGTIMIKNLLNLAYNYFHKEIVFMEVFEGCPIIPLLHKFHFQQVAYQQKYAKEEKGYLARIVFQHFSQDFSL